MRTLHVFDPRQLSEPLCTRVMDDGSGQLLPMWDDSMGCVVIAGKGDTILRCYELATLLAADLPGTGAGETETEPLRRMAATCEKACEFTALTDRTPYVLMLVELIELWALWPGYYISHRVVFWRAPVFFYRILQYH